MVWPPQTSGDEDFIKLATYPGNPLFLGSSILRVLRPGTGKQNRIRRKRRSFQPYAAESCARSDFFNSFHSNCHCNVQGTVTPVEPFCSVFLPDFSSFLRISEIKRTFFEKSCKKVWK